MPPHLAVNVAVVDDAGTVLDRGAFGVDTFGRIAERIARFFGTPQYIIGQSILVVAWIALNAVAIGARWDPYPFILLNLAFSTQAAYAAPLILLAQTRQASRDKVNADLTETHREKVEDAAERRVAAIKAETDKLQALLEANTNLTQQDKELTEHVAELTSFGLPREDAEAVRDLDPARHLVSVQSVVIDAKDRLWILGVEARAGVPEASGGVTAMAGARRETGHSSFVFDGRPGDEREHR